MPIWRKEDRAEHIYRVAAEIMCEKGYEATPMVDIADDQDGMRPARQIADPEQRLRLIVTRHASRIIEAGGAVTIVLEEMAALARPHYCCIKNRKRAYFNLVRPTLEELNPTTGAFTVLGMINWVAHWYRSNGKLGPDAVLGDITAMALGSVLKRVD